MKTFKVLAFLFSSFLVSAQDLKSFQTPPNAAKPRVWWHWMNGNISKEGIKKDLEWFEKTGIGGFQNFDANLFTPVVVKEKLVFMTPKWKEAFKFTTDLAASKGLEMAIAGSPGWSVTGGPWVEPKDGMKKYVWKEVYLNPGENFNGILPKPASNVGKFQETEIAEGGLGSSFIGKKPEYYQDAFVIAYKLPASEVSLKSLNPKISLSGGTADPLALNDGKIQASFELPAAEVGQDMWVQYAFDTPQTFKAFAVAGAAESALAEFNGGAENRSLKVSDDGINFKTIAKVSGSTVPYNTVAIPTTTAKYWRMCFETLAPAFDPFLAMMGMPAATKPKGIKVAEFNLFTSSRLNQAEDKAGFAPWKEDNEYGDKSYKTSSIDNINTDEVFDITSSLKPDGSLSWTPPSTSKWAILRLGYSLTGRQNHPASPEATGLEVDKLDKEAVRKYINTYLDMYKDATSGKLGKGGLEYMILDSYEAGHMNWTHTFPADFQKKRGYSLVKYLPTLTGKIVGSLENTEKFLWDFRKTIGELIAENHYDVIGQELNKRGMKRYTESHEGGRIYLADGMDVKRNAEIPMSAMWTPGSLAGGNDEEVRSEADIREAASVANIYGKTYVAAESMTSVGRPFQEHPERLKRTADLELASGLNRFVIHTSVHQPLDKAPGFSLGPFGQYFSRLETWSGAGAKAWASYLGRSSHLLQQGKNVADFLYLYGENTNITWVCREKLPEIPKGHEFDFVNATALKDVISVKNEKLIAKSGNTYEGLILDPSTSLMTLDLLKKIKTLALSGVKISGKKPMDSPSLSDNKTEFSKLADEIWALPNVGDVIYDIKPDLEIMNTEHKILFRHRQITDNSTKAVSHIYWLNNRNILGTKADLSFRVSGLVPELWDPETGKTSKLSYEIKNGRTLIKANFKSWDAFFIVFKNKANKMSNLVPEKIEMLVQNLDLNWDLNAGGNSHKINKLESWSNSENKDLKYFSGTATYSQKFNFSNLVAAAHYVLDLGEVKQVAEVILNGQNLGTVWKTPFKIDLGNALKNGENNLEIKVTNTWVNRLIGDAQKLETNKTTFTTMPFYKEDGQLMPSGLISDVKIMMLK